MTARYDLILRRVKPMGGQVRDIGIRNGTIATIAERLEGRGPECDGEHRDVIPGLRDHHLHLFATAAQRESVDLSGCEGADEIGTALRVRADAEDAPRWIRATGFTEWGLALPDRHDLDRWIDDRPLRIQDRTGALWLLNSAAIAQLGGGPFPDCVETDARGLPTGRIWRGDAWLRAALPHPAPSLRDLSLALAAEGVTAVTDAGAANGPQEARLFETALASGDLVQRLTVMGTEELRESACYQRGPLKLLYDERDPADPADIALRIRFARGQGRNVAAHCVTEAELILYLEALAQAGGAQRGDRVEHGSLIPEAFVEEIAESGLAVVTQPAFIHSRGDRYAETISLADQRNLYRLRSLLAAGIQVRAGSDAPYGPISPWLAMATACTRCTATGQVIGGEEALCADAARAVFELDRGDGICEGGPADLCLLAVPVAQAAGALASSPVDLTLIAGEPVYERPE